MHGSIPRIARSEMSSIVSVRSPAHTNSAEEFLRERERERERERSQIEKSEGKRAYEAYVYAVSENDAIDFRRHMMQTCITKKIQCIAPRVGARVFRLVDWEERNDLRRHGSLVVRVISGNKKAQAYRSLIYVLRNDIYIYIYIYLIIYIYINNHVIA